MVVSIVQKTDMQVTRAPRLLHLLSRLFTLCTFVASASGKQLEDHRAPAALESVLEAKENPKAIKLPVIIGHDLRFRRLPVANGLSQTKVSQIVQDDLGFLWFGTQYGLNRFDGYNFKVFKHEPGSPNSLSGVFVRSLFKDLRGNLWIGCDEFLDRYDPVTEAFVHYSIRAPGDDVPGAVVRHISQGRNGLLWLSTARGLYTLDAESGRIERLVHNPTDARSLSSDDIESTMIDSRGMLWVASMGGLDEFDPASRKVLVHVPVFGQGHTFCSFEDSFGEIWIYYASGSGGLSVYDRTTNVVTHYAFSEHKDLRTDAAGIHDIIEDRNGTLWLATSDSGLLKFERGSNRFISYRPTNLDDDSLADDQLDTLFQDSQGSIWIGFHEVAPNYFSTTVDPFERFTHRPGSANQLGGVLVSSVYEDQHGVLWISSGGSLNRINRKTGENRLVFRGRLEWEIHSMAEDESGILWGGTARHGLREIDENTGQVKSPVKGAVDPLLSEGLPITRLLTDSDGSLWATTWDGLRRYDETRKHYTLFKPSDQRVEYYAMARDRAGILWLGSKTGLHRFDPASETFRIYSHDVNDAHSLSDSQVNSVHIDASGTIWLGTQDGLDRFDPSTKTFEVYRTDDGLPGNVVSCILSDRQGNLWMSTNNGVSKFDRQRHIFTNYSTDDGLSGNDLTGFGECYESPHGEMFFGGFAGATGFYPSKVVDTVNEPKIVLTDFRLFDVPVKVSPGSPLQRTITLTDELTLSHGSNSLSVGFAAINFAHSTEIRYRYKLAGLDESWHVVDDSRNVASYTALPPSKYTFVVQESVRGHPWSEPGTALQINILPAWWNTCWFRTVYATVIVVLMSIAYRFRLNQITAQLQVRMDERLRERNRIARELHDTLLQGFQGLVLRFQAVVKTLPTGSAGHRMMEEALDRADNVLLEGRRRVQDLRDEGSTGTDLADALAQYGKELAEGSGVGFSVSIIGQPHPLDPIIRDEVYCIEREAMANAFRHSRAAKIEVEITYTDVIRLTVRDDGVGIDQKILDGGRAGHWGLSGMRERAQSIGADLNLWSHPAAGTEVELIVRAKVAHQARLQGSR